MSEPIPTKKIVALVAGTRPEVIKMAPVYFALKESDTLRPVILSTAQHRQMLDQAFTAFGITPEFDLDLMRPGQDLTGLTARVLGAVGEFLKQEQPDAILTQGDTTSVLASSLAAFYAKIPVGHVEAGLRTHDMDSPFPEEMNRRLVDPLCRWCFPPTELSLQNLLAEQIPADRCHVTGNTVIDSLLRIREKLRARGAGCGGLKLDIPAGFQQRFLENPEAKWILVTGHRRESFGGGFENICKSILRVVDEHPEVGVLYPVHLNPQVREPVAKYLEGHERIALVEPAAYEDFIWLMDRCHLVLSDSGGVQEEAPSLGKPVLVMRESTERPEGIDAGTCVLVGTDPDRISAEVEILMRDGGEYARRSQLMNPYGDGSAADRIRVILERDLV
ncbi:MAG: UDP-N-acetylglucosamine 2-epimerase (non-hydrolyzing) [Verrucomicrobiales bacterium]|jgi:UDP-N-acetylglucosamine 2-epimerase (non-hydrolysing)